MKILVVEDSKVTLKSLCLYLERMEISQPLTAETGEAALEIFRRDRPDLVLLDAILPDMDGFDIARQMREMEEGQDWTAIIFLTSKTKDSDLALGIEAGGDDYLMKPVSEVVLRAKIKAMQRLVGMQRVLVDITRQLNAANRELQRLSTTDNLTGIANRRMFDELSQREWRRCARQKKSMAMLMVDIDFFKQYNDLYGHQAGDRCLQEVAREMQRAAARPGDLAARYGGEEFALILSETDLEGAVWVANRLCQRVAEMGIKHEASKHGVVTVSCGLSAVLPGETHELEKLIKSADHALYQAKGSGRNQVASVEYGKFS